MDIENTYLIFRMYTDNCKEPLPQLSSLIGYYSSMEEILGDKELSFDQADNIFIVSLYSFLNREYDKGKQIDRDYMQYNEASGIDVFAKGLKEYFNSVDK